MHVLRRSISLQPRVSDMSHGRPNRPPTNIFKATGYVGYTLQRHTLGVTADRAHAAMQLSTTHVFFDAGVGRLKQLNRYRHCVAVDHF